MIIPATGEQSVNQIQSSPDEWLQLQNDPQRSGYSTSSVTPPFQLAWTRNFQPDRIARDVQAIICAGKVFIPTQSGKVYALNAATGQQEWVYSSGSPIFHTPACANGIIVTATLGGNVIALQASNGAQLWSFTAENHTGFVAAPLIANSKVYIGERRGTLYALNLLNGNLIWRYSASAPIFNSAAFNNNQVYFCDEALYVHAVNAETGARIWKSDKLYGQSCKQYHPVVYQGYVLVRTMMTHYPFVPDGFAPHNRLWDTNEYTAQVQQYSNFLYGGGSIPQTLLDSQQAIINYYAQHPFEKSLFVLNESDGKEAFIVPHYAHFTLPGPPPPPVVDGQRGGVIIPWIFAGYCWGRLDLQLKRIVNIILPPSPWNGGNPDESLNASVASNLLFMFHTQEGNAQWTGIFDWNTRSFYDFTGNPYHKPNFWWQLTDNNNNGNNSVSIANGYFYHITQHQLGVWKGK